MDETKKKPTTAPEKTSATEPSPRPSGSARPPADSNTSTSQSVARGKQPPLGKKATPAISSSPASLNFILSSTKPPTGSKASKPACRKATNSKLRPTYRKPHKQELSAIGLFRSHTARLHTASDSYRLAPRSPTISTWVPRYGSSSLTEIVFETHAAHPEHHELPARW